MFDHGIFSSSCLLAQAQLIGINGPCAYECLCRWCVASNVEPREMERCLLQQIDYPANYMKNGSRRLFGFVR
jgi:hypothetical protein